MKTNLFIINILLFYSVNISAQIQHALGMPEYNSLAEGYENKLFIASNKGKVINAFCSSAVLVEKENNGEKYFLIIPKVVGEIFLHYDLADLEGKIIASDSLRFSVKPFPEPGIVTSRISKGGGRITVALDNSIFNARFRILKIEFNGHTSDGDIIPAKFLLKEKIGNKIEISITVNNLLTDKTSVIKGFITITE